MKKKAKETVKSTAPNLYNLGKKYVLLGKAMQLKDTNIETLVGLASDCGLDFQYRLLNKPVK